MKTQICTVGDGFRSLSTLKILKWAPVSLSYICVQISIFGAFSISRQIQYRENLGQTSGDYPIYRQNLGRSAKSKNPDRLGFSRHMKPGFRAFNHKLVNKRIKTEMFFKL